VVESSEEETTNVGKEEGRDVTSLVWRNNKKRKERKHKREKNVGA